ncbi:TetR/AcrR family transcriptional regulator [Leucobacter japonicus]|uniref:TetR/AcrR family transcriptional regulator n=1 Tax=Leucobacter japonicus TaxID=1461259 RepID=UPI001F4C8933|nr:TetR/AcrR family transcriptional regulator [Leucobacter japonicus]
MPRTRSETARRSVLASTRAALAADGYAALTIEGLAAEAGVSKQTIYRWWPSKAAILAEALLDEAAPDFVHGAFGAALPVDDSAGDLAEQLATWLRTSAEHLATPEGLGVARALIAVTATDPEVGAALNARLAAPIRDWVGERLAQATAHSAVRDDVDAILLADHLIAMTSYAALTGLPLDTARVRDTVDLVMRGIAAPRTE